MHIDSSVKETELAINWGQFFRYLGKELISVLLAPLLALILTIFTEEILNPSSLHFNLILENCFHSDILLSVLSVYIILYFEYIMSYQDKSEEILHRLRWLLKMLKAIGFIFLFALLGEALFFKTNNNSDANRLVGIFNIIEATGFAVCIVLQCVSHPKNYMAPRKK